MDMMMTYTGFTPMSGIISAEGAEKAFHTLERPKIADNINPVSKPHTSVPIIIGTQQKDMFAGGIEITAMSVSAKNNITPHNMPVMASLRSLLEFCSLLFIFYLRSGSLFYYALYSRVYYKVGIKLPLRQKRAAHYAI